VETGEEHFCAVHLQRGQDVLAGVGVRRRGQRHARHGGEQLAQFGEVAEFGAEFVAPLGDAVGLVDGEQCQFETREDVDGAVVQQALGGDVEQVEPLLDEFAVDVASFLGRQLGVQRGGGYASLAHGGDLVVHQRNQRRYHHRGSWAAQRGNLVADAFAAAGRHQDEGVAAGHDVVNDGFLRAAEAWETKDAAEDGKRGVDEGLCRRVGCEGVVVEEGLQH